MFDYEIIFPPADQLELRRKQLDEAGFEAWLSPPVLIATIYVWRTFFATHSITAKENLSKSFRQSTFESRLRSILNTAYIPEFGPLQVQIVGAFYLLWLLFLILRNTGQDYLHLTKAFGHVAISQLPFHYLLAWKTPRSPITLATGLTPFQLNAYHRLFGRVIHMLLGSHAVLYIRFFVVKGLLAKRIQDRDVQLGILAFWSINILSLLALPAIRKQYRKVFYRSHVTISGLVISVLFFHVPYTRRYVIQAGVFWLANRCFERPGVKTKA